MSVDDGTWFRSVLDAMRDMVLVKDTHSRLLWANRAFRDYYGMTEAELRDIVDGPQSDPDDTQQYVRDDLRVVRTGTHLDVPSEQVTDAAGVARAFHTVKSPILDGDEVIHTVGVSRLLDDPAIATAAGHEPYKLLATRFRRIVAANPAPSVLLDVRGRIVSESESWIASFGEGEGDRDESFITRHPRFEPLAPLIERAFAEDELQESRIEVDDGEHDLIFDLAVRQWRYDEDEVGGLIVVATDITREVQHQRLLQDANDRLRRVNEDLDHFTHICAHDLREPVRRQLLLTDMILEDHGEGLDPDLAMLLDQLQEQAKGMLGLIDGFRELSNLGGTATELVEVELPPMIDGLVATLDPDHSMRIDVDLPPTIRGYAALVRTLFQNLIVNALVHAPRPAHLRLSHRVEGGTIVFAAENPYPDRLPDDIFQPFVSRGRATGGGLGLSICRRVVERHRGRIWLGNTPGVFSVHFTLEEATT